MKNVYNINAISKTNIKNFLKFILTFSFFFMIVLFGSHVVKAVPSFNECIKQFGDDTCYLPGVDTKITPVISSFTITGNSGADSGYTNTTSVKVSIEGSNISKYLIKDGSTTIYSTSRTKPSSVTLANSTNGTHTLTLTVYSSTSDTASKTATIILDTVAPVISVSADTVGSSYAKSRTYTVTLTETNVRSTSPTYYFTTKSAGITSSSWCTSYSHTTTSLSFSASSKTATITKNSITGTYYLFIQQVTDKAGNASSATYKTLASQVTPTGSQVCTVQAGESSWYLYYSRYGSYLYDNQSVSISSFSAKGNSGADSGYSNQTALSLTINANATYYKVTDSVNGGTASTLYDKSSSAPSSVTIPTTQGSHKLTLTVYSIGSLNTTTSSYTIVYDTVAPIISVSPNTDAIAKASRNITVTASDSNLRSSFSISYYFSKDANGASEGTWCTYYSFANGNVNFTSANPSANITHVPGLGYYYLFLSAISDRAGNQLSTTHTTTVTQTISDTEVCNLGAETKTWEVGFVRYGSYLYDPIIPKLNSITAVGNSTAESGYTNQRLVTVRLGVASTSYYKIVDAYNGTTAELATISSSTTNTITTTVTLPNWQGKHVITAYVYSPYKANSANKSFTIMYDTAGPDSRITIDATNHTLTAYFDDALSLAGQSLNISTSISYIMSQKEINLLTLRDEDTDWLTSYNPIKLLAGANTKYYLYFKFYPSLYRDKAGNNLTTSATALNKLPDDKGVIFSHVIEPYSNDSFNQYSSTVAAQVQTRLEELVRTTRTTESVKSIEFNESNVLKTINTKTEFPDNNTDANSLMSQGYSCMKEAYGTTYACVKSTITTSQYKNKFLLNISPNSQIITATITELNDKVTVSNEIEYAVKTLMENSENEFFVSPINLMEVLASTADNNLIVSSDGNNYLVPLIIINTTPLTSEDNNASASEKIINQGEEIGNIGVSFIDEEQLEITELITLDGVKVKKVNSLVPGNYMLSITAKNSMGGITRIRKTIIVLENEQEINEKEIADCIVEFVDAEEPVKEDIKMEINTSSITILTISQTEITQTPTSLLLTTERKDKNEENSNDDEDDENDKEEKKDN